MDENKLSIDRDRFVELLAKRFPEVAADIDESAAGLVHNEFGALARATLASLRAGDRNAVREHFAFADELFRDGTPDVVDAVAVAYLERLDFNGRKARAIDARGLLSPRLAGHVAALTDYWREVRKSP